MTYCICLYTKQYLYHAAMILCVEKKQRSISDIIYRKEAQHSFLNLFNKLFTKTRNFLVTDNTSQHY